MREPLEAIERVSKVQFRVGLSSSQAQTDRFRRHYDREGGVFRFGGNVVIYRFHHSAVPENTRRVKKCKFVALRNFKSSVIFCFHIEVE
jgi:hypothetical protein